MSAMSPGMAMKVLSCTAPPYPLSVSTHAIDRGSCCVRRCRDRGVGVVADGLAHVAHVAFDCLGLLVPAMGAALDFGEQKRDRARCGVGMLVPHAHADTSSAGDDSGCWSGARGISNGPAVVGRDMVTSLGPRGRSISDVYWDGCCTTAILQQRQWMRRNVEGHNRTAVK